MGHNKSSVKRKVHRPKGYAYIKKLEKKTHTSVSFFFQLLYVGIAFRSMNFPLNTTFIVSHKFGYVLWSFLLNFRKSLISFLTHWWFRWALFNFHVFVSFLKLVLLLNSNFHPWWSDKMQGVIPFILGGSVEVCFVTEYVVNFWEGSMRCWEESIFFYVWMEYSIDVC